MKKTLIKFLVLCIAICTMMCVLTACGFQHEHIFTNYTSDNNATYNNDGTKTATCDYEGCEETHTIVDAGTKLQSYIEFKTLSLEEKNIFSNATEMFSFLGEIEIKGNAKFSVSLDLYGTQIVLTKIVPLTIGDNKFYVFELIDNDVTKVYEITIRRRPMYEVTFNVNGGTETQSQIIEESFMATEPETAPTREGYTFDGWDFDFSSPITENTVIDAKWTANGDTPYRVEYYFENIDDDGYTLVEEQTENLTGKTDTTAIAEIKNFEHFTATETTVSGNIDADGSTVLKVYYTRNRYSVILNAMDNKGSVNGGGTFKYGTQVTAIATVNTGYTFDGWYNGQARVSANLTYTFTPTKDVTLTAKWAANGDTPYTIEYYQENLGNSGYSLVNSEEKSGKTDDTINITPKTIEHFTFNSSHVNNILSATIKGDGSTVLKIYYTRNSYTVTLNAQDSKGSVTGGGTFKYGTQVTAIATVNIGYTFDGWYNGQTRVSANLTYTFTPTKDVTLTAKWKVFIDENIDENVLADFDEQGYECTLLKADEAKYSETYLYTGTGTTGNILVDNSARTSGVAYFKGYAGNNYNIKLQKTIDLADISAIYLKIYSSGISNGQDYTSTALGLIDGDGNMSARPYFAIETANKWITITIPVSKLMGTEYTDGFNTLYLRTYTSKILIDEIGVVPANNEEMNEFYYVIMDSGYQITGLKDKAITDLVIPDCVTSIGIGAFYNCSSLTSVTIGNSVTSIGYNAFYNCESLTSVTIGDSVTSIGESAFYDCSSLTSVVIPDCVTSIGAGAFSGCTQLKSVNIGNNVVYLEIDAFGDCTSLETVVIGSSLRGMSVTTFLNCTGITQIIVNSENQTYKSIDGNLYSIDGKVLIKYAVGKGQTSFTIPNSVTSIYDEAFARCDSLTKIVLPNNLKEIGVASFGLCTSLKEIVIPDSVISVGDYAFAFCDSLTLYCEAESKPSSWISDWNSGRPVVWGYKEN